MLWGDRQSLPSSIQSPALDEELSDTEVVNSTIISPETFLTWTT
jgi:hypothetical protein